MRYLGKVITPSSSKGLLPIPSGWCGSSIRLKFSVAMFLPSLSTKQLLFSEYIFRLKFEEKTKASISPTA